MAIIFFTCLVLFVVFISNQLDKNIFDTDIVNQKKLGKQLRDEIDSLNNQLFLAINKCIASNNCLSPNKQKTQKKPKQQIQPPVLTLPQQNKLIPPKFNQYDPKTIKSDTTLVIAFDSSINMTLHPNIGPVMEKKLTKGLVKKDSKISAQIKKLQSSTQENRLARLKPILNTQILKSMDKKSIGLIRFSSCDTIKSIILAGDKGKQQAHEFINKTQTQGLSPLSNALTRASELIKKESTGRKSIVLLITHGGDHCGVDFCTTANQLKQQNPSLIINIVNLGRTTSFSCIAEKRLGNVYQPITKTAWEQAINDAVSNTTIPEK